jgi:hypothetical protein
VSDGEKKESGQLRYRSMTVCSLADFVETVQMLQDEWSDLEADPGF